MKIKWKIEGCWEEGWRARAENEYLTAEAKGESLMQREGRKNKGDR